MRLYTLTTLLLLLGLFSTNLLAQNPKENITISGYIKDGESLETLVGANVIIKETNVGATTNVYGYYAMQIPKKADSITLMVSYIGYVIEEKRVWAGEDINYTFELSASAEVLAEVVITEDVNRQLIEKNQMGVQQITSQKLKTIPVAFGESDILKVVQLAPGVQSGSEGTSGFYVRGGGYDQNLILLDEATVYNPDHFFGFFSTFNSDIIKNLDIYKSDFPARYGGRLSSVLDVQMKDGNMRKWEGQGGIGLISSRFMVEGPLVKDRSSIVLSGRRTYFDIFTPLINNAVANSDAGGAGFNQIPDYYFYDLNLKANYILGDKDRIFVSGYFGRDNLSIAFGIGEDSSYKLQWGNLTGTLRWNHIFSPKLFSNTTFNISRFLYQDEFSFSDFFFFRSSSRNFTYNFKQDFDYYAKNNHNIKFGLQATHHIIQPTEFTFGTNSDDEDLSTEPIFEEQKHIGEELAVYVSDDWKINSWFSLKMGLRYSGFLTKGGKTFYSNLEPRMALNYQMNEKTSIKASYARMSQYLNQVKFSYMSFLDPWFPANDFIAPQLADQVSVGWNRLIFNDQVSITNEYYYKWMYNQLEYKNGAEFLFIDGNYHERLAVGKGFSYGTEVQIQKTEGKLTGWLAYTLSWTQRDFPELSEELFPFTYDRRHVVNLVTQYELPKNWLISLNWTYQTGIAFDITDQYLWLWGINFSDSGGIPEYQPQINNFRMPPYHRMDVGAIKKFKKRKKWESELAISVYNAYNRANPFFIYQDIEQPAEGEEPTTETGAINILFKQTSLFPILPSVSYNFKF